MHIQHAIKALFADVLEILSDVMASIIYKDVNFTQRRLGSLVEITNARDIRNVAFCCKAIAPKRFDLLLCLRSLIVVAEMAKRDVRAFMRQSQCNAASDPARPARHNCCFTNQFILRHIFFPPKTANRRPRVDFLGPYERPTLPRGF